MAVWLWGQVLLGQVLFSKVLCCSVVLPGILHPCCERSGVVRTGVEPPNVVWPGALLHITFLQHVFSAQMMCVSYTMYDTWCAVRHSYFQSLRYT